MLAKRRHGPLLHISGALRVLLQGLHDLTVVQHESHELVLPLSFGRGAVGRPDQLQLLQVLEGLRIEKCVSVGGFTLTQRKCWCFFKEPS